VCFVLPFCLLFFNKVRTGGISQNTMNANLLNQAFVLSPELGVMLRYFLKTDEKSCYGLIDLFKSFDHVSPLLVPRRPSLW
jgi:hypothetical protein